MNVYISTALERRADALRLAALLRDAGHAVVSTWHDTVTDDARATEWLLSPEDAGDIRNANLQEIDDCRAFVCIADRRCRGTLVEYEHAMHSLRVSAILVGDWRDLGPMACAWDTTVATIDDVVPAITHDHGGRAPHDAGCVDESEERATECCRCQICKSELPDTDPHHVCTECRSTLAERASAAPDVPRDVCKTCDGKGWCPNCQGEGFVPSGEVGT